MDCNTARSMISAYHEERLAPELRAGLERHLASCSRCGAAEKEMRSVHESLVALFVQHRLSADFDRQVVEALPASGPLPAARRRPYLAWASVAAAAVLGITLLFADLWHGDAPRPVQHGKVSLEVAQQHPSEEAKPAGSREAQVRLPSPRAERKSEQAQPEVPVVVAKGKVSKEPSKIQLAQKREAAKKEPREESREVTGHGKLSKIDSELLTSPLTSQASDARPKRPARPRDTELTEEQRRKMRERREAQRGETGEKIGKRPKLARKMSAKKHPGAAEWVREHPKAARKRFAKKHPKMAKRIARRRAFLKKHPEFAKFAKKHPRSTRQMLRRRFQKKHSKAAEFARKHPEAVRKFVRRRRRKEDPPERPDKPKRPNLPRRPNAPVRPNAPRRPNAPANGMRPNR